MTPEEKQACELMWDALSMVYVRCFVLPTHERHPALLHVKQAMFELNKLIPGYKCHVCSYSRADGSCSAGQSPTVDDTCHITAERRSKS